MNGGGFCNRTLQRPIRRSYVREQGERCALGRDGASGLSTRGAREETELIDQRVAFRGNRSSG
jgi:hypothetical protein